MKQSLFFLILFYFAHFSFSQNYSRVKVFATDFELNRLSEYGVTIDHGIRKENTFYISDFSKREIEILTCIANEMTNEEIAVKLELSKRTVDNHRQNMLNKLKVKNSMGLLLIAMKAGLLEYKK